MHSERLRRRLADAIHPREKPTDRTLQLRYGIVDAIRGDNTLDVRWSGSGTPMTFCPRLKPGSPVVGETVVCLTDGVDLVVLGVLYQG